MKRAHAYLLAFAIQLALAPFFVHDWDGFVFLRSAQDFLAGLTPYEVAASAPSHVFLDDHWPPLNTWYAYPPLALLLFTPFVAVAQAISNDPLALRVGLKLPFILGNLALAYAAGRLAARIAEAAPDDARRRAERWILFNPFLVFIAAAWGMFDATMMALLVASIVLLDARRPALGGVAFGLAALVKVFPLFVAPVFLIHMLRRGGARLAAPFVAAAAGVFALVCLPFFLRSPQGFLQQVLLMHAERSPQGFALVSFPLQLRNLNNLFGWSIPIAPEAVVVAVSSALLLVVLALLYVLAHRVDSTRALVAATLVVFLALLLVNKVVNEQYLVLPIALLAILLAATNEVGWRKALRAFTWGGLASGVLIGLHFLTFVPADISRRVGLGRPDDVVGWIATVTDLPVLVVFSIPHVVAILALVPAMLVALRLVVPALAQATRDLVRATARVMSARATRPPLVAAEVLVALLLVAPPVASAVLALPDEPVEWPDLAVSGIALARYDLAIHNPSHDPAVRDGYWLQPGFPEPAEGFYAATTGKVQRDLATLRDIGIDVVLVAHSAGNRLRLDTFVAAADEAGLRVAPTIDLGQLGHCPDTQRAPPSHTPPPGRLADTPETRDLVRACAEGALAPFRDARATFRIDGEPVLVVLNATAAPSDPAFAAAALPDGAFLLAGTTEAAAPPWADAAYAQPPQDAPLSAHRANTAALLAPTATAPRVAAVTPGTWSIRDPDAYDTTWQDAIDARADWVIIPWNVHRDGGVVEPTTARADLVPHTAARIAAWRAG